MKESITLVTTLFAIILMVGISVGMPMKEHSPDMGRVIDTRKIHIPVKEQNRPVWDLNGNRISDILEERISRSEDTNAILMFDREITRADSTSLEGRGFSVVSYLPGLDMVEVRGVMESNVGDLLDHAGVDSLWHTGNISWYGDVQTPNIKARESDDYSPYTAWELGYTGKGVNIAVMDTGIDNEHPSLKGKWVGGADISKPETFFTPRDGSFDADDPQGHGTTCSGIATGTGAPEGKYMGAAPDAKLVDLRIGTVVGYAPGEVYQDIYDASLQGAQWALDHKDDAWQGVDRDNHGIDIVSLSWGVDVGYPSPGTDPYSVSLNRLIDAGIHVVAAAGNDGPNNNGFHGMGAADGVICVGATDDVDTVNRTDDIIASYSSRGPRTDDGDDYGVDELKPDVSASGTHIFQCQYSSNPLDDASGNGYGNRGSGTSYATPSVAGVVAMMLEANPELTPAVSKEILRATAERREEPSAPDIDPFWNRDFGWGIVDAYKAVKMAEDLASIEGLDIELQCFITNFSVNGDVNVVNGIAWSRIGKAVDTVTISGWGDTRSLDIADESPGSFVNWSFEFTSPDGGSVNISAVARSGGQQSLIDTVNVILVRKDSDRTGLGARGWTIIAVVAAAVSFVVLGGFYLKRKRTTKK